MKYFSTVLVLLLPIGTAAALGRDNANDEVSVAMMFAVRYLNERNTFENCPLFAQDS